MSKPSVKEALANRKPDEEPVKMRLHFDQENVTAELDALARAQQEFELQQQINRVKGAA
jgi:hypothetical protein